jgi:hypothetical protein
LGYLDCLFFLHFFLKRDTISSSYR